MNGKKFRKGLFGYRKSDVYDYIRELDARYAEDSGDKENKIKKLTEEKAALMEKYDELQSKREIIVSVLEKAHIEADGIISEAKAEAAALKEDAARAVLEMKNNAEAEIEDRKAEANREIEIKQRTLRNMYESESRRIDRLRDEVSELRQHSVDAIKAFENELCDMETRLGYRGKMADEAATELRRGGRVEPFKEVKVPIKVIRRNNEAM